MPEWRGSQRAVADTAEAAPDTSRRQSEFHRDLPSGNLAGESGGRSRPQGATLRFNYSIVDAVAITGAGVNEIAGLQREISVLEIIPDRAVRAFGQQTTPEGVKRVGEPVPGSDGSGIGVAVVDTGIDWDHPDLSGRIATDFFAAYGDTCLDDEGHGTHVAGIIAALDNDSYVVGVAPGATLYCVKVLDSAGFGWDSDIMAGLNWVVLANANPSLDPKIRVVNMSLGRLGSLNDNSAYRAAVQALYNEGIAVVVAAGNDPSKEVKHMVPATYPEVFAVASTTAKDGGNEGGCASFTGTIPADTASYFTTDGKLHKRSGIGVTISAPGAKQENVTWDCFASSEGILSLELDGDTTSMSGTSMAAPHVAGIVARMMQVPGPGLTDVETIRSVIRDGADRKGEAPLNSPTFGYSYDREREGIVLASGGGGGGGGDDEGGGECVPKGRFGNNCK